MSTGELRPAPADVRDAETLRRWYWLRAELVEIARTIGVSTTGGKLALADRVCAHFEHRPAPPAARDTTRDVLPDQLTGEVVVQEGQRCTQRLREWMRAQIGPSFSFDAPMRDAVRGGEITLRQLVERWHATRGRQPDEIAPQFELNRFARTWHREHPNGTHAQMLDGWAAHRRRPRAVATRLLLRSRDGQEPGGRRALQGAVTVRSVLAR